MSNRPELEYASLAASRDARGTARMILVPVIFIGWGAAAIATAAAIGIAIATLVPLLILAAGFEALVALHASEERLGRYIQVFHADVDGWGRTSAALRDRAPGAAPDPLFGRLFVLATSINFVPVALSFEYAPELAVLLVPHFLLINRIRVARTAVASQRSDDLQRLAEIHGTRGATSGDRIQPVGVKDSTET